MDDILKQWNIDTTGCQICDEQYTSELLSEPEHPIFSSPLIHRTVDEVGAEAGKRAQLMQVLNVILGRAENNRLLVGQDTLSKDIEKCCFFLS